MLDFSFRPTVSEKMLEIKDCQFYFVIQYLDAVNFQFWVQFNFKVQEIMILTDLLMLDRHQRKCSLVLQDGKVNEESFSIRIRATLKNAFDFEASTKFEKQCLSFT